MSTKAQASAPYSPGQDPESIEANRAYQDALKKLTESLDQRKNRYFEPTLLAAAQGFLQPGTSNFFDSLGNVAGNIAKSQEAQIAEDQAIAQQRFELAGRGVELQRQKNRDAMFRSAFADEPAPQGGLSAAAQAPTAQSLAAGSGALPSGGQGATGPLAQATANAGPRGTQIAPAVPGVTKKQYLASAMADGKSLTEALEKWEAIEKGRIQKTEGSIFNIGTGMAYRFPTGKIEQVPIFRRDGTVGTYPVSAEQALELGQYARFGEAEKYFELADQIIKGPQMLQAAPQAAAAAPGAPAAVGAAQPAGRPATTVAPGAAKRLGLPTAEESELEKARTKTLQDAQLTEEIENRKDFSQRSKDASETLATANVMRSFADRKDFKDMTGILNNDKVFSGIATLVRDGVGGKNFTIGIPAIEDVMRNARLTTEQQATYRTFLMFTAQMQLNAEKAMKGSTTERERLILGNANISPQDTAETVRRKADLLTAKAQFDRQSARAFKSSKMTAEEFLDSEDYMKMYDKYYDNIVGIANGLKQYQSQASATKPSSVAPSGTPQSAGNQKALEALRKELAKGQKKP